MMEFSWRGYLIAALGTLFTVGLVIWLPELNTKTAWLLMTTCRSLISPQHASGIAHLARARQITALSSIPNRNIYGEAIILPSSPEVRSSDPTNPFLDKAWQVPLRRRRALGDTQLPTNTTKVRQLHDAANAILKSSSPADALTYLWDIYSSNSTHHQQPANRAEALEASHAFSRLMDAVANTVDRFTKADVVQAIDLLAKLCHEEPLLKSVVINGDCKLLNRLCTHLQQPHIINGLQSQDIVILMQALGSMGAQTGQTASCLLLHTMQMEFASSMQPSQWVEVVKAVAHIQKVDHDAMQQIGDHLVQPALLSKLNASDVAAIAWSYAKQGIQVPHVLHMISNHIIDNGLLSQASPSDISKLVWAYRLLEAKDLRLFFAIAEHFVDHPAALEELEPRLVVTLVGAYAGVGIRHVAFMETVAQWFVEVVDSNRLNAHMVATISWAFAVLHVRHEPLMAKVAAFAQSGPLSCFAFVDISNLVWSFAILRVRAPNLMNNVASHLLKSNGTATMNGPSVVRTAWAFARSGVRNKALMIMLTSRLFQPQVLRTLTPSHLADLAWVLATQRIPANEPANKLAAQLSNAKVLASLSDKEVVTVAWAFAQMKPTNPTVMQAIAKRCLKESFLASASCHRLSLLASAFSTAHMPAPVLMQRVAVHASNRTVLAQCTSQDISHILVAFSKLGIQDTALLSAFAAWALEGSIAEFSAIELTKVAWAVAYAQWRNDSFMDAMAHSIAQPKVLSQLRCAQIATLIWAFARLGAQDVPFLTALAARAAEDGVVAKCTAKDVVKIAWACGKLGVSNDLLMAQLSERAMVNGISSTFSVTDIIKLAHAYAKLGIQAQALLQVLYIQLKNGGVQPLLETKGLGVLVAAYVRVGLHREAATLQRIQNWAVANRQPSKDIEVKPSIPTA